MSLYQIKITPAPFFFYKRHVWSAILPEVNLQVVLRLLAWVLLFRKGKLLLPQGTKRILKYDFSDKIFASLTRKAFPPILKILLSYV